MRASNSTYDAANALAHKTPMALVHFDGETTDYCNHTPASPTNALKQYLISISGGSQRITPEEGKASISGWKAVIQDKNNEIMALLAADAVNFHRKKTVIKLGYAGMAEADMLTATTGWVFGIKLSRDGLGYEFTVTDPQQWMQRKVFRDASDTNPITIQGHPIDILLQVLISTGDGTNGDYDILPEAQGLGLSTDYINVANIEQVRDDWFPRNSMKFSFTITERVQAKQWIQTEILKPLNCYPAIDADGKYNIRPFKPPLAATTPVQSFSDDNIIDPVPKFDLNFPATVNEVEVHYDWDGDKFASIDYFVDDSLDDRGPGKKPITIKSKGIKTSLGGAAISENRKQRIFNRFATPPPKISFSAFYSRWLSEAGDVVPFSHGKLPDLATGTRGISQERMEIINRSPDHKNGKMKFELLATGFKKNIYGAVAPSAIIVSGISATQFTVSSADASKFTVGWEVIICQANMVTFSGHVTITDITGTTVTVDDMGGTPQAGYIVNFANYDNCTIAQQHFCFVAKANGYLGAANDAPHLVAP